MEQKTIKEIIECAKACGESLKELERLTKSTADHLEFQYGFADIRSVMVATISAAISTGTIAQLNQLAELVESIGGNNSDNK